MRMPWAEIRAFLFLLRGLLTVQPLMWPLARRGWRWAERYGLSIYDAMIVAAALQAGCDTLWSEDMQHCMTLGGLRVLNPFQTAS